MRKRVDTNTWNGKNKGPKRTISVLFQPEDLLRIKESGLGCGPFLRAEAREVQRAIVSEKGRKAFGDKLRQINEYRWKSGRAKGRTKTISVSPEAQMIIADIARQFSVSWSEVIRTILLSEVNRLEDERKEQSNG